MTTLPALIARPESEEPSRFWSKVDKNAPAGCWLWTASVNHRGYGQFSVGSRKDGSYRMLKAHRVAYMLTGRELPNGLTLDHLCRNRRCVNPAHLEPVTNTENILRGISLPAINARKTHCDRGHQLSGSNVYVGPSGKRMCRPCKRSTQNAWRRTKAALKARAQSHE